MMSIIGPFHTVSWALSTSAIAASAALSKTCGIEPALDVVVHTLAPNDQLFQLMFQPFPLGRISKAVASITSPLSPRILTQHADKHRPECPVLLAVDQQFGEGAALRVAPELSVPVGPLEVREHKDVEQLGAGSRAERVQALLSRRSSSSGRTAETTPWHRRSSSWPEWQQEWQQARGSIAPGLRNRWSGGAPDGLRSRDLRLDRAVRTAGLLYGRVCYSVVCPQRDSNPCRRLERAKS
jgi:hypothetical protein